MICGLCKEDNQYFQIDYVEEKIPILFGEIHFKGNCCTNCKGTLEHFQKKFYAFNNAMVEENKGYREQEEEYRRSLSEKEKGVLRD